MHFKTGENGKQDERFYLGYEAKIIPLYKEANLANWEANVNGTDEAWARNEKASIAYISFYTDKEAFAELKELKESALVKEPLLARQLELIYNMYLQGQIDTSLISEQVKMETEITKKYGNFRATVNGKQLSDNEVESILRSSTNSTELQAAWEGHKMIGPVVADDVIKLVKHRNKIAQQLGFSNYHQMSLELSGQEPEEVTKIFDELDSLTRDNFAQLKGDIDAYFSKRYGIPVSDCNRGITRTGTSRKLPRYILLTSTNIIRTRTLSSLLPNIMQASDFRLMPSWQKVTFMRNRARTSMRSQLTLTVQVMSVHLTISSLMQTG